LLPLHDRNPTRSLPIVTVLLIVANVAVFIYELQLQSTGRLELFVDRYAFDFTELTAGLQRGSLTLNSLVPLVAHMFLHGGLLHIGSNMLYLWIFGNNVEDRLGRARFLVFYVLCGIVGALAQGILRPAPMIGASGAVAGTLGAYLVMFPGARVSTLVFLGLFVTILDIPAMVVIGFWALMQFVEGLAVFRVTEHAAAQIAYFAHIAGFVAGIVFIALFRPTQARAIA
jgi:membrane associated rhomboid family serine protease